MTPKQRFESSIRFRQPDDMVAMMEVEFQLYKGIAGREPIVGFEFANLTPSEKEGALAYNAELMVETARLCGHDAIRDFGGYWELWPGQPAYLWLPDEQSRLGQIRALKRAAGDEFFILGSLCATMGMPDGDGIEDFVISLFDAPDEVKKGNEERLESTKRLQGLMLDAGADGILSCCDVAYKSGPFISPAMMDEFFFPYLNRWAESLGPVISIWHTDGNLKPVLDRIIESGVSAIQCVDPLADMDIVEIKKACDGKLALIGNIDSGLLETGSADDVRGEVRRVVEGCKYGGGFVLGVCNAVYRGIPVGNYRAYCDARVEFGGYINSYLSKKYVDK